MKRVALISTLLILLTADLAAKENKHAGDTPRVTYIANEGFLVEHGGKKVLLDGLFNGPSGPFLTPPAEALSELTEARGPFAGVDLLLVTHSHGDHFNPKLVIAHLRNNPRSQLIAHTQVAGLLRQEEGFAQVRNRVHEIHLAAGAHKRVTVNGIGVDVLCLAHVPYYRDGKDVEEGVRNLAFIVHLGGVRFLHLGDATVENSLAHLNAYPFGETPVDLLFLGYQDRSPATRQFIGRTIRPSQLVAMHVPPAELAEQLKQIWAVYPFAAVFRNSMEQRTVPIEVDFHNLTGDYFEQGLPRAVPEVFARGIVSSDLQEHGAPSFSPDGNELFWWSNRPPGSDNGTWIGSAMTMRRENGRWSAPYVSGLGQVPDFSADGRRAYFSSTKPGVPPGTPRATDIWFVERRETGWSKPTCLNFLARYPELRFALGPSIARNGTLYFGAYTPGPLNDYGIYRSEFVDGEYARPELLPRTINLPPFLNWTPFIAPDESYLLFSSNRTGSLDEYGDLYISRRVAGGSWSDPVSLGETVNTNRQERVPRISNDGKYLFFSRWSPEHQEDVFWVEAGSVPALGAATSTSRENEE